jgi:hypothetical protein
MMLGMVLLIVALVLNGIAIGQLDSAMTTANSTVNDMPGLYDIMGIFGLPIFITLVSVGLAAIGGGAYGAYKTYSGGGSRKKRKS